MLTFALFIGYSSPKGDALLGTGTAFAATGLGTAYAALLVRYYRSTNSQELPEAPYLAAWFRSAVWCFIVVSGLLGIDAIGWLPDDSVAVRVMVAISLLPGLEWVIRSLHRDSEVAGLVDEIALISLHFQRASPVGSLVDELERIFGVDLRSTWALKSARRATHPLLVSLTLIGWLSSGVVSVRAHETAIVERFGTQSGSLTPGLHLKAPWPIDRVHRVPVGRVNAMPLGYAGQIAGSSQLWTKQHAQEEYSLLLGNGRELVAVNALLHYQISNPAAWHYSTQNPEHALQGAAERALLRYTVGRSLDGVLSENTTEFSRRVEQDIQRAIGERGLGVTVVSLSLQGLHPPVDVATDYQAVVSAQHQQETSVLNAATYETKTTQIARSAALDTESEARQASALRVASAEGESAGFAALAGAYQGEPTLFRFRRRLESLESSLSGTELHVIDENIERDGGSLWFSE